MLSEINKNLLTWFNSFSTNENIEILVKIFVDFPIFILPVFLLGYWIYYSYCIQKDKQNIYKNNLLLIFYGTALALIVSLTIQQFVNIERPEQHLQAGAKLLLDHLPDASFPSDHATVSIAFLTGILLAGYKKWFWVLLLPFILMGVSRIVAGVHWPFDIVAGSFVGIISSYLVFSHISQITFVKNCNAWIIKILKIIKL